LSTRPIRIWFTSEDGKRYRLSRQPDVIATPAGPATGTDARRTILRVDPEVTYQSILGMGSSLEEATVYHLSRMSPETRQRVLRGLLDREQGVGWNLFRICFGTSDFTSQPYYSYDDVPPGETDEALAQFSIQKDIDNGVIDVIREVLACSSEVLIFASPWSPPGWMKSSGSMCAGRLLPRYYAIAARYYRLAIQAYEAQGIPIYAFTLQNEPLMVHTGYPTCYMSWEEQNRFLKHVRREFDEHNLKTRVWIFDHNFKDALTYPARILSDPESYAATDGVALHDYEGEPAQMGELHDRFPEKDVFLTEHSTFGARGVDRILQYFRNWARSYNAWVTCLDDRQQPNPGPHHCSPTFVTVDRNAPDQSRYIPEYYLFGQVSRFVQRGAVRIESTYGSRRTVTSAAFANPDGTTALIVVNQTRRRQALAIAYPGIWADVVVPARTVATYVW